MKGEEHEQTTLRQYIDLQRVSKIARRIAARPGNLERATCRGLSVSFEWKRSRRRTPAIASEVRSSLYGVARPRTQLLTLSVRSEEHTSELQSQSNLVCRLLLEKKKKKVALPIGMAQCVTAYEDRLSACRH